MNPDLHAALLGAGQTDIPTQPPATDGVVCGPDSTDEASCEWWTDDQGDERLPRWVRTDNLDCPIHHPAPVLPSIVVDVAAVIGQHRRTHQECSCPGGWPLGLEWDEHVAIELHRLGLIGYQPSIAQGLLRLLNEDTRDGAR